MGGSRRGQAVYNYGIRCNQGEGRPEKGQGQGMLKSRGLLAEGPWNVEGAAESKEQQLSSLVRF